MFLQNIGREREREGERERENKCNYCQKKIICFLCELTKRLIELRVKTK